MSARAASAAAVAAALLGEAAKRDSIRSRRSVWEELRAGHTMEVQLSHGYETQESLVWSPRLRTFLMFASCC